MIKKQLTSLLLLICASFIHVQAQNCTIVSSNDGCLKEPFNLQVSVSGGGTPTKYTWDFDPGTSDQANPAPVYTTPGIKNISVVIDLPGGGKCTANKQITIHDPPVLAYDFTKETSFCREVGEVCIKDNSKPGVTGSKLVKWDYIWGDGNADFSNLPNQEFCNKYLFSDTFEITIQVRNDKGCTAKDSFLIFIGKEFDLKYKTDTVEEWCDSIRICFTNESGPGKVNKPIVASEVQKLVWDFGDGEKDTLLSNFAGVCHTYTKEGLFTHSLEVTNLQGCNRKYTMVIDTPYKKGNPICNVHFSKYTFGITKDKDSACWDEQVFAFSTQDRKGAEYEWAISQDPDTGSLYSRFALSSSGVVWPNEFGRSYIRLRASRGDACKVDLYDSVEVCGPRVNFSLRNDKQCKGLDTVYFCDKSNYFCVTKLFRLWCFDDPKAEQCTTDLANNINVGKNCNYSKDPQPQHFYSDTGCYSPRLALYDSVTMCGSEDSSLVEIGVPDVTKLSFQNQLPCEGDKLEYVFQFDYGRPCFVPDVWINYDSACDPTNFVEFKSSHIYTEHCQEDDSVTLGLRMSFGRSRRYIDCDNYYDDPSNICTETKWYHDMFKLTKEPEIDIDFVTKSGDCIPLELQTYLKDSFEKDIVYLEYKWMLNDYFFRDSLKYRVPGTPSDSLIRVPIMTIDSFGVYQVDVKVVRENGCYDISKGDTIFVGFSGDFTIHDNDRYSVLYPWLSRDTLFCVGDTVRFNDSITYFNTKGFPWRFGGGGEGMIWDFGDGGGFNTPGPIPIHVYDAPGVYNVRVAAYDKFNCWDTIEHKVYISGVEAGVKKPTQSYLCDDIVQLFDSSTIKVNLQGDYIDFWYWNYGDGTVNNFVKDPFHSFKSNGFFTITHAVRTHFGCVDTVEIQLEILGPKPSFDIVSDTVGCVPHTVEFNNTSSDIFEWIWSFGDNNNTILNTRSDTNVTFTYTQPGWYNISLFGSDSLFNPATGDYKYCSANFPDSTKKPIAVRRVLVLPIPPVDFDMPTEVCVDEVFNLIDNSDTIYELYKWHITAIGDSILSSDKQVSYSFSDTGTYTINYTPTYEPILPYQRRCYDTSQRVINVQDVFADFVVDTLNSNMPVFFFYNRSSPNAVAFDWEFGHPASGADNYSDSFNAIHDYESDTGTYKVCLTVYNQLGCWDSICRNVQNRYFAYVLIPNVFTPENGDGFNDAFDIDIFGEELYDLTIYNRYGAKVFQGDKDGYGNDGVNWDGTTPGGLECPAGTYYFVFKYRLRGMDEDQEVSGVVTLIRPKN